MLNDQIKSSDIIIRNSELLAGAVDKSVLGSGSKQNMFYVLLRDWGEDVAITAMWRLTRMINHFNSGKGISLGIGDLMPSQKLLRAKEEVLSTQYDSKFKFDKLL